MRTSICILAFIFGCAIAQTAGTNYCNAPGTFCTSCTAQGNNKSCDECARGGISTPVQGQQNTNECTRGSQSNCFVYGEDGKCAICDQNFAIDPVSSTCSSVSSSQKINNCLYYVGTQGVTVCAICTNGKVQSGATLSDCNTSTIDSGCQAAYLNGNVQTCVACKVGYAVKPDGNRCDTRVSGDLAGCMAVSADGTQCLGACNYVGGYWMTDVTKCTLFAPLIKAGFTLIAGFLFIWN